MFKIRKIKDRNRTTFKTDWFEFTTGWHQPCLKFALAGYFDQRPQISLSIGWGILFLNLPFKTKYNECEPPEYGFYLYSENGGLFKSFWLCLGRKNKYFYMPWSMEWHRTSMLKRTGEWEHETKGNKKDFYEDKWSGILHAEKHPYTYTCKDGTVQNDITATVEVSEVEWRPRWFEWTSLFSKVRQYIDVEFDNEVGERRGEWKGGTLACSYEMFRGETPYQALQRMEATRKF